MNEQLSHPRSTAIPQTTSLPSKMAVCDAPAALQIASGDLTNFTFYLLALRPKILDDPILFTFGVSRLNGRTLISGILTST